MIENHATLYGKMQIATMKILHILAYLTPLFLTLHIIMTTGKVVKVTDGDTVRIR
jgi:hypothetical protein